MIIRSFRVKSRHTDCFFPGRGMPGRMNTQVAAMACCGASRTPGRFEGVTCIGRRGVATNTPSRRPLDNKQQNLGPERVPLGRLEQPTGPREEERDARDM